ncbi:DUF1360 domain-containing protein [Mycolicibacterium pulveris]|uniref:DUF1360 domain-containing protein n=1 Tax=Mycolicibacterium pulveris TaxID=36813 RepID=A0A7I7UBP9_MYCPV|nr:DUF1360 domain-containing protein [Mycolicibacterium pulveris]MCV6982105.1 DUF1360 domain-containing protein [Mycolicibacterium pulveris]BBY78854.1 hypothetical protein MPUL_00120 [Mycolicibacterium pulveris]
MNQSLDLADLAVLVIYVLAVARVTLLVNTDRISDPLRLWVAHRAILAQKAADEHAEAGRETVAQQVERRAMRWDLLSYLLGCPWCVGLWLALGSGIVPVRLIGWSWWVVIPLGLACSYVVGLLSRLTEDENAEIVASEG